MMSEVVVSQERAQRIELRRGFAQQIEDIIAGGGRMIRSHEKFYNKYVAAAEGLRLDHRSANFGLGDIDTKPMLEEAGFEDLPSLTGTEPGSEVDERIHKRIRELKKEYWDKGQSLERYSGFNGIIEVRQLFSDWFWQTTGLKIGVDNTYFSAEGASGAIKRDLKAAVAYCQSKGLDSNFLTSTPGYEPVISMAADQQDMEVSKVCCGPEDNYFFKPEEVGDIIEENKIGVFYIVPINNPTSTKIEPSQLKNVLIETRKANPNILFFVDLAYITSLPQAETYELTKVFDHFMDNCVFHSTTSKSHARPGSRFGATHTQVDGFDRFISNAAQLGNPSINGLSMAKAVGVMECVSRETVERTAELYAQRRELMIKALGRINDVTGEEIFVNLDRLQAPGGLYVYPEISKGLRAADLFVKYGLLGIDGKYFSDDPESNRVRLAIGLKGSNEIESLHQTLDI